MAEKSIELDSVEIAAAVFGNCDRNIRMLEKEFSVTAVCRGTMLRISGEPANVAAAARAVEGMLLLIENHTPLEDQTVRYCLSLAHDGEEKRVRELTEDFVTVTVKGRPIRPKTLGQKEYLNSIRNNAITFGVGPVGTGKTYTAACIANELLAQGVSVVMTSLVKLIENGISDLCSRLSAIDLLILDDLGAERSTDYALEQVYNIVDSRYRAGLPVIYTTNLTLEELKNPADMRYARIYDRVLEKCFPVEFRGVSRRKHGARQGFDDMMALLGVDDTT